MEEPDKDKETEVSFSATVTITIGPDGLCCCDCGTPCPLGKWGMEERCTMKQLRDVGYTPQRS